MIAYSRYIQRKARMRLERVVAATALSDLRVPPSHRLEALRGDRAGQHSIRSTTSGGKLSGKWRLARHPLQSGNNWTVAT